MHFGYKYITLFTNVNNSCLICIEDIKKKWQHNDNWDWKNIDKEKHKIPKTVLIRWEYANVHILNTVFGLKAPQYRRGWFDPWRQKNDVNNWSYRKELAKSYGRKLPDFVPTPKACLWILCHHFPEVLQQQLYNVLHKRQISHILSAMT